MRSAVVEPISTSNPAGMRCASTAAVAYQLAEAMVAVWAPASSGRTKPSGPANSTSCEAPSSRISSAVVPTTPAGRSGHRSASSAVMVTADGTLGGNSPRITLSAAVRCSAPRHTGQGSTRTVFSLPSVPKAATFTWAPPTSQPSLATSPLRALAHSTTSTGKASGIGGRSGTAPSRISSETKAAGLTPSERRSPA